MRNDGTPLLVPRTAVRAPRAGSWSSSARYEELDEPLHHRPSMVGC